MPGILLVTTSYPDSTPGSEAAGSFVEDFALALSEHIDVTVLAASRRTEVSCTGRLEVHRFAVPRLPLSLLRAHNPLDWPAILNALKVGRYTLRRVAADQRPEHIPCPVGTSQRLVGPLDGPAL